ncbi:MAG: hypothetical protein J6C85_00965 [Alphaproteobacteria bacterium]|nr:hypothetical protein [Alphaproteobacteria bacterium]MBP3515517.1 hypothetical protein [Alphaproteobacteria bacterium]
MENNDGLDSFITNTSAESGSQQTSPSRPKLRKIKRPKIRPAADILQAPDKIMPDISQPEETRQTVPNDNLQSLSEEFNTAVLSVSSNEEEQNKDISEGLNPDADALKSTELITATEAQNVVSQEEYNNPYVLDGLPPELDYMADDNAEYIDSANYVKKNVLYIAAFVCLFVGLFIGKALFASQRIEQHGLEGVVLNPDVPAGRPRCGLTDRSQACIFYLMNWYKQELTGRDFYKLAAQLTGREEYMIETENLRYATIKIKPGHFAQLNIPAIK